MIILDFNALAISHIITQQVEMNEDLIRHQILNNIRVYRNRFKDEYGEIVVACDSRSWRKEYYPQYKANRKTSRDKSPLDWDEAFRIITMIKDEIKENFPYKVIHIERCEADDIIGTLVENTTEFGQYENVMIVSSDKDFVQLQKYDNVKQWSPVRQQLLEEPNPKLFLMEHILRGDTSDGVPNVLSDDDVFVMEEKRQTPLSKKKMSEIIQEVTHQQEMPTHAWWYRNYCRNKKLIDLAETPDDLKKDIIQEFESQDQYQNKGKVFPFLVAKRCKMLLETVEEFI
jgi:hypothetical protein